MFHLPDLSTLRPQIPSDSPLEDLHHIGEQGACQSCIPSPFGAFIPDERVLRLNLEELVPSKRF